MFKKSQWVSLVAAVSVLLDLILGILYLLGWLDKFTLTPNEFLGVAIGQVGFHAFGLGLTFFVEWDRKISVKSVRSTLKMWNLHGVHFSKGVIFYGLIMTSVIVWRATYGDDPVGDFAATQEWISYHTLFQSAFLMSCFVASTYLYKSKFEDLKEAVGVGFRRVDSMLGAHA